MPSGTRRERPQQSRSSQLRRHFLVAHRSAGAVVRSCTSTPPAAPTTPTAPTAHPREDTARRCRTRLPRTTRPHTRNYQHDNQLHRLLGSLPMTPTTSGRSGSCGWPRAATLCAIRTGSAGVDVCPRRTPPGDHVRQPRSRRHRFDGALDDRRDGRRRDRVHQGARLRTGRPVRFFGSARCGADGGVAGARSPAADRVGGTGPRGGGGIDKMTRVADRLPHRARNSPP